MGTKVRKFTTLIYPIPPGSIHGSACLSLLSADKWRQIIFLHDPVQADHVRDFADLLRMKNGVEARNGVLGEERVEFFRGKDFSKYVKANPEKCVMFVKGGLDTIGE
jgi:hypothetical protein